MRTSTRTLLPALAATVACAGGPGAAAAEPAEGLRSDAQSIHEEVEFAADCARIYRALTDTGAFDSLTRLGDAAALLTEPKAKATAISDKVGGAFTLFGGYITGRNLQMIPGTRLVQAWRAASWDPGDYSVVRFELKHHGAAGCQIVFDHRGFPKGQGESLAHGWRVNYWEPLAKLLAAH
jgi:activator of HSP90 ATPase